MTGPSLAHNGLPPLPGRIVAPHFEDSDVCAGWVIGHLVMLNDNLEAYLSREMRTRALSDYINHMRDMLYGQVRLCRAHCSPEALTHIIFLVTESTHLCEQLTQFPMME